ncbi:kinase-like domain-containing protein [Phycomyces nitens]|nr:kinase-like domain-containing protein [Phycomyces nitens]
MIKRGSPCEDYCVLEQIGNGSFGSVHRATHKSSHRTVAIKIMKQKFSSSSECSQLREYKTMKHLLLHPNVVQLYDTFLGSTKELCFIMEYMDRGNLYQLIKEHRETSTTILPSQSRDILRQILAALAHIHRQGIFHRDMKPENLLLGAPTTPNGSLIIKLADFGLARELKSKPPYTEYVSTRWYRAPEVLLRSTSYSSPVDLWAVGAIFAEIVTLRPLFPGQSEIDQLYRICQLLGSPCNNGAGRKRGQKAEKRLTSGFPRKKSDAALRALESPGQVLTATPPTDDKSGEEWPEGVKLAQKIGFCFPAISPRPLQSAIPMASQAAIDIIRQLLHLDPAKRLTAAEALLHPIFNEPEQVPTETNPNPNQEPKKPEFRHEPRLDQTRPEQKQEPACEEELDLIRESNNRPPKNKTSVTQEIKDAFRLSKARMKDTTLRKKVGIVNTKEPDVTSRKQDPKGAFDLPSIPLSPFELCSDWDPGTIDMILAAEPGINTTAHQDTPQQGQSREKRDKDVEELDIEPSPCTPLACEHGQPDTDSLESMIDRLLNEMDTIGRDGWPPEEDGMGLESTSLPLQDQIRAYRNPDSRMSLTLGHYWQDQPACLERKSEESCMMSRPGSGGQHPFITLRPSISTPLQSAHGSRIGNNSRINVHRNTKKPLPHTGFGKLNLFGLRKSPKSEKATPVVVDRSVHREETPHHLPETILRTESFPTDLFQQLYPPAEPDPLTAAFNHQLKDTLGDPFPPTSLHVKPKKSSLLSFWAKKQQQQQQQQQHQNGPGAALPPEGQRLPMVGSN